MKFIFLALAVALIVFMFKRSNNNKELALENQRIGDEFLAQNKLVEGVRETDSGLQYFVINKGEGEGHPSAQSIVEVHYHGTLLDGTVFDSSVVRGTPISFGLNQVIKGWTEGLQLMVVGDKFKFFIPARLAYGDSSAGKIAPGSVLIFEVELLSFK